MLTIRPPLSSTRSRDAISIFVRKLDGLRLMMPILPRSGFIPEWLVDWLVSALSPSLARPAGARLFPGGSGILATLPAAVLW